MRTQENQSVTGWRGGGGEPLRNHQPPIRFIRFDGGSRPANKSVPFRLTEWLRKSVGGAPARTLAADLFSFIITPPQSESTLLFWINSYWMNWLVQLIGTHLSIQRSEEVHRRAVKSNQVTRSIRSWSSAAKVAAAAASGAVRTFFFLELPAKKLKARKNSSRGKQRRAADGQWSALNWNLHLVLAGALWRTCSPPSLKPKEEMMNEIAL